MYTVQNFHFRGKQQLGFFPPETKIFLWKKKQINLPSKKQTQKTTKTNYQIDKPPPTSFFPLHAYSLSSQTGAELGNKPCMCCAYTQTLPGPLALGRDWNIAHILDSERNFSCLSADWWRGFQASLPLYYTHTLISEEFVGPTEGWEASEEMTLSWEGAQWGSGTHQGLVWPCTPMLWAQDTRPRFTPSLLLCLDSHAHLNHPSQACSLPNTATFV